MHWKCGLLTTGPPGKSLEMHFNLLKRNTHLRIPEIYTHRNVQDAFLKDHSESKTDPQKLKT